MPEIATLAALILVEVVVMDVVELVRLLALVVVAAVALVDVKLIVVLLVLGIVAAAVRDRVEADAEIGLQLTPDLAEKEVECKI